MRTSNGAAPMTGRTSRRALGIAVAGGAAVFALASGGIAMASPLPGHGAPHGIGARPSWSRVTNARGIPGAGHGKSGRPWAPASAPVQGQPGWNRVSNTPDATGGQGGVFPGPGPVMTGGQGGRAPADWSTMASQG